MILGSSGSPRKRNFVPDLLKSLPEAISATKNPFSQKKLKSQKITKIKNLQNRPENQQLGPKLIQDDSPSLNNPFPTIFNQILDKKNAKKTRKSHHFYALMGWLWSILPHICHIWALGPYGPICSCWCRGKWQLVTLKAIEEKKMT